MQLLERKEYFGQYGKVTKVSLSRTAGGTLQQFTNDTCSVYVTVLTLHTQVAYIMSKIINTHADNHLTTFNSLIRYSF